MTTVIPPSVAVMVAEEAAALMKRLATLKTTPAERIIVAGLLQETMQDAFDVALGLTFDVAGEHTQLIGTKPGAVVDALGEAGEYAAKSRDAFGKVVKAFEDVATEQAEACEADRPSNVYATPDAQTALAALRTRLAEQHGVTR